MAQTALKSEPDQAYEGKVQDRADRVESRLASELIYFGKAVSLLAVTDLAVGGAAGGPQSVKLPAAAADITGLFEGVAIADPSIERLDDATGQPAPYGAYPDEASVSVLRRGRVWVVTKTLIADITVGVYVRFQKAGGSPPVDQLGSFEAVAGADVQVIAAGAKWRGATTDSAGAFLGLLELNLPA